MSVGSELLHGLITDRNAVFFTQELTSIGVEVVEVVQVGDSLDRLIETISRLATTVDLIVISGGIGPTRDDLTREAIAAYCGETPQIDAEQVKLIEQLFSSRGQPMPERNLKQAWLIPSSTPIRNPNGTAPGWFVQRSEIAILSLPGPPRENQLMWQQSILSGILPELIHQSIRSRTLKTIGIGESAAEREIQHIVTRLFPITATYAKSDGVHIRVTATHESDAVALAAVNATVDEISELLQQFVYGEASDSLARAILKPLIIENLPISIWEAGSSGALAQLLQGDPSVESTVSEDRSTSYAFASEDSAQQEPEAVALYCAQAIAEQSGSAVSAGLAVRSKLSENPIESHAEIGIAFVHPTKITTRTYTITAIPEEIRRRAALWSAELLWREINAVTANRRS